MELKEIFGDLSEAELIIINQYKNKNIVKADERQRNDGWLV